MFLYKFPIAIVTTMALLQPPIAIAQDIAEVNNIARNISVKITGYGNGSGFILKREENIYSVVTNKHVVPMDTEYQVQTYDGTQHQVINRQEIPDLDLAIIQFESTKEYEVAKLGNSDELQPRQSISVAGFPGEQTDIDIIDGQIRSIRQEIIAYPESSNGYALIYTNQTLPGSSGGAVLDELGRVVAINGEASIDHQTGRDISRGIPINLFVEPEEKLLGTENNVATSTASNSESINTSYGASESSDYQLAYTTPNTANHNHTVDSVAINGDKIASGSNNHTIKIYDLATGKLERILTGHSSSVQSVAISGDKIVSGSENKTIKIWNLATGELEQTLTGHSSWVESVAISGDKIVSGSWDNTIKVWNLATGKLEKTLTGHSDSVNSVAISEDRIVSGSSDNTIKIWQLKQHKFCILTDC